MTIYIASDHGGFELKNKIVHQLEASSQQLGAIVDLGPYELNPDDDYPDYAIKLAEKVTEGDALGILICRSGNGMCIAANKVKGAYAALAFSKHHAEMARIDDNANIICLDADYEGEDPVELVKAFIQAKFAGMDTRHGRRFQKIVEYESKGQN